MLQPGSWIAGYRVERALGSGGMGAVYLAKHPELPRSDAIKVLGEQVGENEQFRKRFLREAEVAAGLDHPNIVTIYNRGRNDGMLWISMQYVAGTDCAQELHRTQEKAGAQTGLPPERVVRIASEIARGLDYAHRKQLLHRDIKPANILLSEVDGSLDPSLADEQRVLLTDFGVAKAANETESLTVVGTVLATLSYASPEQLKGQQVDPRTDQYSLAATTFHLIAGRVPFKGESTADVITGHLSKPVPKLSELVPSVPPAVDSVIAKAMAKEADDRFANCRQFTDALQSAFRQSGGQGSYQSAPDRSSSSSRSVQQGATRYSTPPAGQAGSRSNTPAPSSQYGQGAQYGQSSLYGQSPHYGQASRPAQGVSRHSGPQQNAAQISPQHQVAPRQAGGKDAQSGSNAVMIALFIGLVVIAIAILVAILLVA
ncbi:serine/threonine-protein kinase [Gordonia rubripertincta]|uniref:non-specific serine/threonine protein kinase n=1 Tax=Gordonia rubripertincta TaxID=36822 RepID=A0ABT4MQ36_GORRU|nr:serine/threonine-protein kinase [Gordonia rubripertincta]MCZ4549119.1 serine/threonine-protein kinase [Gordonia rubripertincta]